LVQHRILSDALAACLESSPIIQLVQGAIDPLDDLSFLDQSKPDVIVLGLDFSSGKTDEILANISEQNSSATIVLYSGRWSDFLLDRALKSGVLGFVGKGDGIGELTEAIEKAAIIEHYFSDGVSHRVEMDSGRTWHVKRTENSVVSLSSRQLEVIKLLAEGLSVKQVARELDISVKSVDSHKYRIMRKLGLHHRVELVRFAIREGLSGID